MELFRAIKKSGPVLFILTIIIVMGITACSGSNDTEQGVDNTLGNNGDNNAPGNKNGEKNIDKHISEKYDLPEDNQANHGQFKVMETELGYYYNIGLLNTVYNEKGQNVAVRTNLMNMFFFDKESQIAVHLCDKPECRHQQTDDCVATYNKLWVFGQEIYDGYLYTYGEENNNDISTLALYRTALDGSSIDRIATVFEAENKTGSEYIVQPDIYIGDSREYFVIHKGYAYCPYYLQIGKGKDSFRGGGITRIDIKTGKTEKIYEMTDTKDDFPYWIIGTGDYVYFGMADRYAKISWYRYDTDKGIFENSPWNAYDGVMVGIKNNVFYTELSEDKSAEGRKGNSRYDKKIIAYRIKDDGNAEKIYENVVGETGVNKIAEKDMLVYGDYFVTIEKEKIVVYSAKQDNFGEKLGELAYEQNTGNLTSQKDEFKICNDIIYRVYTKPFPDTPEEQEKITHAEMGTYILNGRFYQSCAIADIISGKGEWSETFRTLQEE